MKKRFLSVISQQLTVINSSFKIAILMIAICSSSYTAQAQTCSQLSIGLGISNTNPCLNTSTSFWRVGDWQLQNNVKWFVDNVQVGTGSNLNYSFTTAGSHVVKIQGSTSDNSCTKSNTLTVNVPTNLGAVSGLTTVNAGQQGVVYSVPNMGSGTYNWHTTTDAQIVSGQGTNSITVNFGNEIGSSFQIETQHTGNSGCNSTSSLTVQKGTVIDCNNLSLGIGVSTQPPCLGQNTSFWMTGSSTLQSNLTWYINNVQVGTGQNLNYTFANAGTYPVKLVSKTTGNTCTKEATTSVTILPTVGPISGATTVSPNSNQTYSVPNMGAGTYNWWHTTDAQIISGQNTPSANYHLGNSITNSFTVNVGYTSTNGCYTENSLTVNKIEPCIDSTLNAYVKQYSIRLSAKQRFNPNCKTVTSHTFPFEVYFNIPSQITISRIAKIGDKAYLVVEKNNKLDTLVYQLQSPPATNVLPFSSSSEGSQAGTSVATKRIDFWLETTSANGDLISKELINTTQAINARLEIEAGIPTFTTCTNNTLNITIVNPQTDPYPQGNHLTLTLNPNVEYIGFTGTDFVLVSQNGQNLVFGLTRDLITNQRTTFSYTIRPTCSNFISTSTAVQDHVKMEPITEPLNDRNIAYNVQSPVFEGFFVSTSSTFVNSSGNIVIGGSNGLPFAFHNLPFTFTQSFRNSSQVASFNGRVKYELDLPTGITLQANPVIVLGGTTTLISSIQIGNRITIVADITNLGPETNLVFTTSLLSTSCTATGSASFNSQLSFACTANTPFCPINRSANSVSKEMKQGGVKIEMVGTAVLPGTKSLSCSTSIGQKRTYKYVFRNNGEIVANNVAFYPTVGSTKNFIPAGAIRCVITTVEGNIVNRPSTILATYVSNGKEVANNTGCFTSQFPQIIQVPSGGNASTNPHVRITDLYPGETATLEMDVFGCCPQVNLDGVNVSNGSSIVGNYGDFRIATDYTIGSCPPAQLNKELVASNAEGILFAADNTLCPKKDASVDEQFDVRLRIRNTNFRFADSRDPASFFQERQAQLLNSNIIAEIELTDGLAYIDGANMENRIYFQSNRNQNLTWLPSTQAGSFIPNHVTVGARLRNGTVEQRDIINKLTATFRISDVSNANTSVYEFMQSTELLFRLQAYCKTTAFNGPSKYTLRLYYQPDNCNDCRIPLSSTICSVNVNCPGCTVPGAIINAFDIHRTTLGLADTDNNSLPDNGTNTPIATPSKQIRTDIAATGDHLSMSGSCNMNRDQIRYNTNFPFRIPNLYLLQQITNGDVLDVVSNVVTIRDRNTNQIIVVSDVPGNTVQKQWRNGIQYFLYDFSIATIGQFQRGSSFTATEFNDNWNVSWEADLVMARNVSQGNNNQPRINLALPVVNQMFFTGVNKTITTAIADFDNRPASLIGAGITEVSQILPTDNWKWLYCEFINGEISLAGYVTEIEPRAVNNNFALDTDLGQGCTKVMSLFCRIYYPGYDGDQDLFPFEFRPLAVPSSLNAHWPTGYKLDGVYFDQVSDWQGTANNGNREFWNGSKLPFTTTGNSLSFNPSSYFTLKNQLGSGFPKFAQRDRVMRLITNFVISGTCGETPVSSSTDFGVSAAWNFPNNHTDVWENECPQSLPDPALGQYICSTTRTVQQLPQLTGQTINRRAPGQFIYPPTPTFVSSLLPNQIIETSNNRFSISHTLTNNGPFFGQYLFAYVESSNNSAIATNSVFNFAAGNQDGRDETTTYTALPNGFLRFYSNTPPTYPAMFMRDFGNHVTKAPRAMTVNGQLNSCVIGQEQNINLVIGSSCAPMAGPTDCELSHITLPLRIRLRTPLPQIATQVTRTQLSNCDSEFFTLTINNAGSGWLKTLNPTVTFGNSGLSIVNNSCTITVVTNDPPVNNVPVSLPPITGVLANPTFANGAYSWNTSTLANLNARGVQTLTIRYQVRTVCNGPTGDVVQNIAVNGTDFCNSPTVLLTNTTTFNIATPADRDQLAVSIVSPASIQNCSTNPVNVQVTVTNNGATTQRSNVLSLTGTGISVSTAAVNVPTIAAGGIYTATFTVQPNGVIPETGTTFPLLATLISTSRTTSTCSTTCIKSENFSTTGTLLATSCIASCSLTTASVCGHSFVSTGHWANGDCIPAKLGDPNTTTTFTGGGTFSGTYLVDGSIELKDGTYAALPGTVFYMNGKLADTPDLTVLGVNVDRYSKLKPHIIFENSEFDGNNVSFLAACSSMWGGVIAHDNTSIYLKNNSRIEDASVGIGSYNLRSGSFSNIQVDETHFLNNISGIMDYAGQMSGEIKVTNSSFGYDQATSKYYDVAAEYAIFQGNPFKSLNVDNSTIKNVWYGIYSRSGGGATVTNNNLSKIILIGMDLKNLGQINAENNTIDLSTDYVSTDKIGILTGSCPATGTHYLVNNTVAGEPGRNHIGIYRDGSDYSYIATFLMKHNNLSNLRTGICIDQSHFNTTPNPGDIILDNKMLNCVNGVYLTPNSVMLNSLTIHCNTFDNSVNNSSAQAVYIGDGTVLPNDLGTDASPAGNKFVNYAGGGTNALNNANSSPSSNFRYYYNTSEGQPRVSGFVELTESPNSPSCSSRGYSNGNFRMEDDMASKQDNLRFKNGTARELRKYEGDIINYYTDANNLNGLEQYTYSLVNCNRGAYYRLCFYQMESYGNLGDVTKAEAWKQAALQPNPNHAYVKAYSDWFTFRSRNPTIASSSLLSTFNVADSTLLANLTTSGTSFALNACMVLQRAYPSYQCQYQPSQAISLDDNTQCDAQSNFRSGDEENANTKFGGQTWLGTAYPNPAKSDVTINYNLPNKLATASIRLHEIATGRLMGEFPIVSGESFITIPVSELSSGMYAYTLIVDGIPFKSKSLAVIR